MAEQDQKKKIIEPVVVTCLSDIKRVIANFNRSVEGKTVLSTEVTYEQDGKPVRERVEAEVRNTSPRAMLIEGLELVKKRIEFQKISKELEDDVESSHWKTVNFFDTDINKTFFWVDSLIRNRLAGVRHNLCVRWAIKDGIYEWDPMKGDLQKIEEHPSGEIRKVE